MELMNQYMYMVTPISAIEINSTRQDLCVNKRSMERAQVV